MEHDKFQGLRKGIWFQWSIVLLTIYNSINVSAVPHICHTCSHVKDFASCQQNVRICQQGEICFTSQSFHHDGYLVYSSGCVSKQNLEGSLGLAKCHLTPMAAQTCDTLSSLDGRSTHSPVQYGNIIGKRKRVTNTCFRCCANEGTVYRPCNANPCSIQVKPTSKITMSQNVSSLSTTSKTPTMTNAATTTTTSTKSSTTTTHKTTITPTTTTPTSTTPTSTTTRHTTTAATQSCYQCNGMPIYICEMVYKPLLCDSPDKQFCMNVLVNNKDGSRTLQRRCATEQECKREWWYNTSDRTECTGYDPNRFSTSYFQCTYCCTGSLCNKEVVPKDLYVPNIHQ